MEHAHCVMRRQPLRRSTVCLLALALLVPLPAGHAGDGDEERAFLASVLRVEFDQHLDETTFLDVDPSADLTVERCVQVLQELRPGAATVFAIGHEGWARIPDPQFNPHPALTQDTLAIWRDACDRTGTPLFVYVSSLINYKLNREHPEFARQFSNGGIAPQRLDHNSAYVDQYLIPLLKTILTRYRPAGFWLDGDFWSIFPSWNPASVSLFQKQTGLAVPADFGHPSFAAFWRFTIDSHTDYVQRLAEVIHRHDPNCTLVVNGAYTLRQPSAPPPCIGRINIDPPTFFGLTAACLETRFQSGRGGPPLDVVLGAYAEPEGVYYRYPKTALQLAQEAATILANGGHIQVYVGLDRHGTIDTGDVVRLREVIADFCLPRRACFAPSRSVADIAVLHTRDHFDRTHRLDEVHGAALALLRGNRHFDILDDETFVRRADEYALVVVPEQGALSTAVIAALQRFVQRGGGLALSLPSGLDGAELSPQAGLETLLPFQRALASASAGRAETEAGPIGVPAGWFAVEPPSERNESCVADLAVSPVAGEARTGPGRLRSHVGRGRVAVFTAPVFRTLSDGSDPRLRAVISETLDWARGDSPPLQVHGPPWVEVSWRRTATHEIIHLVNHARGKEPRPRDPVVTDIPPVREVRIELQLPRPPQKVRLLPGDEAMPFEWSGGRLSITVPQVHVHAALVIARTAAEGQP